MQQVTEKQVLLPVEDRFDKLWDRILVNLGMFGASLVMKRERDEKGRDGVSLYAVFDSDPCKPMLMMRVCDGSASVRGYPIALSAYVPDPIALSAHAPEQVNVEG